MKLFAVSICIIILSACAAKTTSFLEHESSSTAMPNQDVETDNNIEKYKYQLEDKLFTVSKKIMHYESETARAKSYKRMKRFIGYIQKEIDKSLEIIDEYKEKSNDENYQNHIEYVKCTYNATKSSYKYMEAVIVSEQENQYIKHLDKFREKLRNDAASLFLKDMEKCEKIKNFYIEKQ